MLSQPRRVAIACLALGLPGLLAAAPRRRGGPISIRTEPATLNPENPDIRVIGELEFRGGLRLRSKARGFGSFSALHVSADGKHLTSVSDQGQWLTALLTYDEHGWLDNVTEAEMGTLRDASGQRLDDDDSDAEGLAELPDGGFAVAFEGQHRIWTYPRGLVASAAPLARPEGLADAPDNGGVESLVALADGRLLALTQKQGRRGLYRGWLWKRGRWAPLEYQAHRDSNPADAARLPSGDLLVLERGDGSDDRPVLRLQRVPQSSIGGGKILEGETIFEVRGPLLVDNFEGIACRAGEDGETLVYLLSDDESDSDKRTVLLMFALRREDEPKDRP